MSDFQKSQKAIDSANKIDWKLLSITVGLIGFCIYRFIIITG